MAEQDVQVVVHTFELWNRGDLTAWISTHHPSVVVDPPEGWPEGEQPRSREEWLAQAIRLTDSWAEQRIEVERIVDSDGGVLVLFKWITRGKGSRIDLVADMGCIATVEDGLIRSWTFFNSHEEAVRAADQRRVSGPQGRVPQRKK
jgi:ketosteroid isomerase-like protein